MTTSQPQGATAAARRARFAAQEAPALASAVGGPATPWRPAHRLSSRFSFFADSERLLVVCGPQEPDRAVDLALAYGIALAADRDLVLVLPRGKEASTLARAPWIDVPLSVWVHGDGDVRPIPVPSRLQVLDGYDDPLETSEHALGDRGTWVRRLAQWADADEDLVAAHRPSYLAWHCQGRLVLRVQRTVSGLRASAGVQYSQPGPGQPAPVVEEFSGRLGAVPFHRLVAAASRAAADRLAGDDAGHAEPRLQARLPDLLRRSGLRGLRREFPAIRPPGRRAYVDFLAFDAQDRLHVVETKIGPDEALVLQGLDYWIWAKAHAADLAAALDLPGPGPVLLDFVVVAAEHAPSVGPYTAAQAEALAGSVPWRFHLVTGWPGGEPVSEALPSRTAPPAPRHAEQRFARRLQHRLVEAAGVEHGGGTFWSDPVDGLLPAARPAYQALADDRLLHRMIAHVRSSQAFALNLFAPLDEEARLAVLALAGVECNTADEAVFEWSDPADALRERTPASPHRTQVDALLRGHDARGRTHAALVEVKLSELDFGSCSGYERPGNDARDVCVTPGPFGGEASRCFQLRNHGGPHRRQYDRSLGEMRAPAGHAGCWWRGGLNQPMRNVALARSLVEGGTVASATYVLCAHDANPTIWRRWQEVTAVFAPDPRVRLASVPASAVVALHEPATAEALLARYGL